MIAFPEDHRAVFGAGPICRVQGIAPSTFCSRKAVERDPISASDRVKRDIPDKVALKRVFDACWGCCGARKIWQALRREGRDIARCTMEHLMKSTGIQGVVRGKKIVTTNPDAAQPSPDDKVKRAFAGRPAWSSDRWRPHAELYVAFIVDVFARRSVGWRVSTSMSTGFVPDALNRAICQRAPSETDKLIHHSDRGSQNLSIKYTEQLAEAGIDTSVGRVGDSCDNALAESPIGLLRTEAINVSGPWKSVA